MLLSKAAEYPEDSRFTAWRTIFEFLRAEYALIYSIASISFGLLRISLESLPKNSSYAIARARG